MHVYSPVSARKSTVLDDSPGSHRNAVYVTDDGRRADRSLKERSCGSRGVKIKRENTSGELLINDSGACYKHIRCCKSDRSLFVR